MQGPDVEMLRRWHAARITGGTLGACVAAAMAVRVELQGSGGEGRARRFHLTPAAAAALRADERRAKKKKAQRAARKASRRAKR